MDTSNPDSPANNLTRSRAAVIELVKTKAGPASIRAALSSEAPVDRGVFQEVLVHTPDSIDMSRAAGGLPLTVGHSEMDPMSSDLPVGRVDNIHLDRTDRKLRGDISFDTDERSQIARGKLERRFADLSVTYRIQEHSKADKSGRVNVTRWQPVAASVVSVPADQNVGVGRASNLTGERKMDEIATPMRVNTFTPEQWQDRELDRQEAIRTYFRLAGMRDDPAIDRLKRRCIEDPRMQPEQARDELLTLVGQAHRAAEFEASAGNAQPLSQEGGMGRRGYGPPGNGRQDLLPPELPLEGYSIIDAILVQADPNFRGGGFEREVSQEISLRGQHKPRAGGLLMPIDLPARVSSMATRDLVYGGGAGSGAPLVGVEHRPDLFVDLLRNRSVVMGMGATRITGLQQNQSIPRMIDTAGVGWLALDGTSTITPADASFDDITLEPHQLAGISIYSWRMLRQGLPATEQVIRNDLARAHAAQLDETALQGSGIGAIPTGLSVLAGATPTYTAGSLAYTDITDLESAVYSNNGDTTGGLGFVVASDLVGTLKSTEKINAGGQPIAEGAGGDGALTMSGYPCMHTNGAPSGSVYFGSWPMFWLAQWGAVEILSNPYSDTEYRRGSVEVRLIGDWDMAVRHPESFGYLTTA